VPFTHRRRSATPAVTARPVAAGERGTGVVASIAAVGIFLAFLLFAVQLAVNLHTSSTVSAAGYDAARSVASRSVDHGDPGSVAAAEQAAERQLRSLLGGIGRSATVAWHHDQDVVRLRLVVDAPGIWPSGLAGGSRLRTVERTFVVRIERGP
jgi:Flp pilus assembly protein TadG